MSQYLETTSQHLPEHKIVLCCILYHIVLSHHTISAWKSLAAHSLKTTGLGLQMK